jgi:hypothetical protein
MRHTGIWTINSLADAGTIFRSGQKAGTCFISQVSSNHSFTGKIFIVITV